MITATEHYLAKVLKDRLKVARDFMSINNLTSKDEKQSIRRSLEKQDVIEGYFSRISAVADLFKESVLKEEGFTHLLQMIKDADILSSKKEYDGELILKKMALIENTNGEVSKELDKMIYASEIKKETSKYVSFICPNEKVPLNVVMEGRTKFLKLGDKQIKIRGESNTENCKIYSINKEEFQQMFSISDKQLQNRSLLKSLKVFYKDTTGMLFAPTKLGLTPLFEYDVIRGKKEVSNEFLFTFVYRDDMHRLKYYDVLELLKNNFIPNHIVFKQVKAHKAGVVYTNGWFNSSLVNEKNLLKLINEDVQWNDPVKVKEFNDKWDYVYKNKLKNPKTSDDKIQKNKTR